MKINNRTEALTVRDALIEYAKEQLLNNNYEFVKMSSCVSDTLPSVSIKIIGCEGTLSVNMYRNTASFHSCQLATVSEIEITPEWLEMFKIGYEELKLQYYYAQEEELKNKINNLRK